MCCHTTHAPSRLSPSFPSRILSWVVPFPPFPISRSLLTLSSTLTGHVEQEGVCERVVRKEGVERRAGESLTVVAAWREKGHTRRADISSMMRLCGEMKGEELNKARQAMWKCKPMMHLLAAFLDTPSAKYYLRIIEHVMGVFMGAFTSSVRYLRTYCTISSNDKYGNVSVLLYSLGTYS